LKSWEFTEKQVVRVANTLVDKYNLHPDDALELIDIHNKVVYAAINRNVPVNRIAEALYASFEKLRIANPSGEGLALVVGMIATSVGVFLIANGIVNKPEKPLPNYSTNDPVITSV
jgi:hypothetical protein